jgi:hypothetical protein
MAVISEIRWSEKLVCQSEGRPAQVRERSPVWVPLELA